MQVLQYLHHSWWTAFKAAQHRGHIVAVIINVGLGGIWPLFNYLVLFSSIFQQVSDLVTSTGFLSYRIQFKIATLTYKTLATCQPSYLYNLLQVHQPSQALHFQPKNFSRCHSYLLTLVGTPATALLQHGIQFLLPLKIVPPYTVSSTTSSLTL